MNERSQRIADFARVTSGGTPPRGVNRFYENGDIPWVKTLDLNFGHVTETEENITEDALSEIRGTLNPVGTVMVAMYGGKGTIGKSAVLGVKAATNQAVASILPDPSKFVSDFLHFQLMHLRGEWMQFSSGNRKDPNINKSVVENMLVWLPPTATQEAVAQNVTSRLSEVEIAKSAAQTQLRELRALSDALYRNAFSDITPIAVPPAKEAPPAGWGWRKLSDVARLESGHTPSKHRPDWWGGDISWLSLTEIRALDGTWVEQTQIRTNPEGIANSAARVLPRGTVCLSRTASVGFVAVMGEPMATSQDFANWVCGEELDPDFLMLALIRSRTALRGMATGATHKTIYMPALASFMLCAPGIDEQKRIVRNLKSQLREVEAMHAALSQRANDVAALPQRILAATFEN